MQSRPRSHAGILRAAGETGQLYGSVTSRDIAETVTESGVSINRNQVILNRALKVLGLEPIRISLHPEVSVEVIANIARNKDEAEQQLSSGQAVSTVSQEEIQNDLLNDEAEHAASDEISSSTKPVPKSSEDDEIED